MFCIRAILVSMSLMIWNLVDGSDVSTAVNCAACQYLDGPWNSWQCRVQCDVAPQGVPIMGSVDAFAVVLGPRDSRKQDVANNEIFIFDVVNVNIRGGYNTSKGKFKVRVPGVYKVSLSVFSDNTGEAKMNIWMNKSDGSGDRSVCAAHGVGSTFAAATCGTLLQMEEGDEVYAKGHESGSGSLHSPPGFAHSSFEAYLLYKASP